MSAVQRVWLLVLITRAVFMGAYLASILKRQIVGSISCEFSKMQYKAVLLILVRISCLVFCQYSGRYPVFICTCSKCNMCIEASAPSVFSAINCEMAVNIERLAWIEVKIRRRWHTPIRPQGCAGGGGGVGICALTFSFRTNYNLKLFLNYSTLFGADVFT